MTNSRGFPSSKNVWIFPHSWRISFCWTQASELMALPLGTCKRHTTSSGLGGAEGEIHWHLNFPPTGNVSLFSGCLEDSLSVAFTSLTVLQFLVDFFAFYCFGFTQLLESVGLCFLASLGYFQPLLLCSFSSPSMALIAWMWYSHRLLRHSPC